MIAGLILDKRGWNACKLMLKFCIYRIYGSSSRGERPRTSMQRRGDKVIVPRGKSVPYKYGGWGASPHPSSDRINVLSNSTATTAAVKTVENHDGDRTARPSTHNNMRPAGKYMAPLGSAVKYGDTDERVKANLKGPILRYVHQNSGMCDFRHLKYCRVVIIECASLFVWDKTALTW